MRMDEVVELFSLAFEQITWLLEAGFEHVLQKDGLAYFGKPK